MIMNADTKARGIFILTIVALWFQTCEATQWPLPHNDIWMNTFGEYQRFPNRNDLENDLIYMHSGLDIYHNVGAPVLPVSSVKTSDVHVIITFDA